MSQPPLGDKLRNALSVVALCLLAGLALAPLSQAEAPNQAGLIVVFPDGVDVQTACVAFEEGEIPGTELLRRAGLALVTQSSGLGEAVCRIDDVGCQFPGDDCFCECLGTPCHYWTYWYWQDGDWVYSGMGGSNRTVADGDLDAWVWGDADSRPPDIELAEICQLATVTPTQTPPPTETPTATSAPPTATLTPTDAPPPPSSGERRPVPTSTETTTVIATSTPTDTSTPAGTTTISPTPSRTPTPTHTPSGPSPTPTDDGYPWPTPSGPTATIDPFWAYPSPGATATRTRTPTRSRTPTRTRTSTRTRTPTRTATHTVTPTLRPGQPSPTPWPTATRTPPPTASPTEGYPAPLQGANRAARGEAPENESYPAPQDVAIQAQPVAKAQVEPQPKAAVIQPETAPALEQPIAADPQREPTRDRVAEIIAAGAADRQKPPARSEQTANDYGALLFIAALLVAGLGYALIQRRQRRRSRA